LLYTIGLLVYWACVHYDSLQKVDVGRFV